MDAIGPSLPLKLFVADEVWPIETTRRFMAAHGCHLPTRSVYVLLINIRNCFLVVRDWSIARTVLYKVSTVIVSRLFCSKTISVCFDTRDCHAVVTPGERSYFG